MSCNCNSSTYTSTCCPEVPYPQISSESVPSLIDNLVYALYGTINKSIVNGRVIWDIPCDPANTPATIDGIPRNEGEGLLCYIIRALNLSIPSGFVTVDGIQTLTNKTLVSPTITGTGAIAGVFTGNVTGNLTGNATTSSSCTGNSATATLADTATTASSCTGNSATATLADTATTASSCSGASALNVLKSGDTMTGGLIVSTNTATDAVRITQVGTGAAFRVEDSVNPDSTPFIITTTGDVGIGITTPTNKLHVNGRIYCTDLSISGSIYAIQNLPSFTARIKGDIPDITVISSISYTPNGSGADVTITKASHGLLVDDSITFVGQTGLTTNSLLNGTWKISASDTNTFTFTITNYPTSLNAAGITATFPIRPVRFISIFDSGYGNSTPNSIGRDTNGSYQINFYNTRFNANYIVVGNCCNSGVSSGTFSPYGYSTGYFQFKTYTIGTTTLANFSDINVVIY